MAPRQGVARGHPVTGQRRLTMGTAGSGHVAFALRRGAVVAAVLIVAGGVVERLRPDEAGDRGFLSTPFWWAAIVWCALLLLDATAHERSELRRIEGTPLVLATFMGVAVFVVGVISFDGGSTLDRTVYLAANGVGAAAFWWAVIGLVWLIASPRPSR